MKEKWSELKKYPLLILFFVFLFGFMMLDGMWPKRPSSELERRDLAQYPKFSWKALFANEWTAAYDEYTKDQVVFRDTWIRMQSRSESLLAQKVEIGGALIGKNEQLFTKMFALKPQEEKLMAKNTKLVADFTAAYPGTVTLLLAPSASLIYEEDLPAQAPMLDEASYLDDIFSAVGAENSLDLRQAFTAAKGQKRYYNTDHHWTTEGGAYVAYQEYCARKGLTPGVVPAGQLSAVEDFYGTTYAKCVLWNQTPDTLYYWDIPNQMTIWAIDNYGNPVPQTTDTKGNTIDAVTSGLYENEKFKTADKYSALLYGNQGYTTVEGTGTGKLLVIKDSYANSLVPYLTQNYTQIGVVDPRSYKFNLNTLMETEGYDEVLLVFNFQTFVSNNSLNGLVLPIAEDAKSAPAT